MIQELNTEEKRCILPCLSGIAPFPGCECKVSGSLNSTGKGFYESWERFSPEDASLISEQQEILRNLRFGKEEASPLRRKGAMYAFCLCHPEIETFPESGEYIFRMDTDEHSYYVALFPNDESSFRVCCLRKDAVDEMIWYPAGRSDAEER